MMTSSVENGAGMTFGYTSIQDALLNRIEGCIQKNLGLNLNHDDGEGGKWRCHEIRRHSMRPPVSSRGVAGSGHGYNR